MHLITEEHLAEICAVCKRPHEKNWQSQFHGTMHYQTIKCVCGREIFRKTRYLTSGIDE